MPNSLARKTWIVRVSLEQEVIMSLIFNQHALHGLPTNALEHLRASLHQSLAQSGLSDADRQNLHAALAVIESVLRKRSAPPAPKLPAPSP